MRTQSKAKQFYFDKPEEGFYPFLKEVLGRDFELLEEKPHREMCQFIATPHGRRFRLMAVPRDCFKTTIMNGFIVYDICRSLYVGDMDFSYLIDSANRRLVSASLRQIKRNLEYNEKLIEWFGKFPTKHYWGRDEIRINQQENYITGAGRKEPTVAISSVGSEITGMHFRTVIADDWVTARNIRTPQAIQWGKDHYREIQNVMDKNSGKLYVTCTFWHPDDAYAHIQKTQAEEFDFFIRPIYSDSANGRELFFPKRFGMTEIERLRTKLGNLFYTQYLLQPVPQDKKDFPDKNWQVEGKADIPSLREIYIAYDPADEGKDEATQSLDFLWAGGFDNECKLHITDGYMENGMKVDRLVEIIGLLCKKHSRHLYAICIEKVLFFKYLRQALEKYFMDNGLMQYFGYLRPVDIDRATSKKERIRGLVMPWRNNRIFFSTDIPADVLSEIREEFATYPKCKYFDGLDSLEMISRQMIYPTEPEIKKEVEKNAIYGKDKSGRISIKGSAILDWAGGSSIPTTAPVTPDGKPILDFVRN